MISFDTNVLVYATAALADDATDQAGEHESGPTPRIQGDGLIPAAAATGLQPENDLRRADVPERPSYGDRSPIFAVPL